MSVWFRAMSNKEMHRGVAVPFTFPGGEHHLKDIPTTFDDPVWIADVRGADVNDLVKAALLADVAHQRQEPFVLMLPYLPAARADRGQPLGVRVYADLINSMNPQQVITIDAHSPVSHRYYRNLIALDPTPLAGRAILTVHGPGRSLYYQGVIVPDKGAVGRAESVAAFISDVQVFRAEKDRDFTTGRINSIKMVDELDPTHRYLVIDDICDGGATFRQLAEATGLPKEQLGLWVTHGIFSGQATSLRQHYQHIYTTDSHPGHNRVGCATFTLPVETYMLSYLKEFG